MNLNFNELAQLIAITCYALLFVLTINCLPSLIFICKKLYKYCKRGFTYLFAEKIDFNDLRVRELNAKINSFENYYDAQIRCIKENYQLKPKKKNVRCNN